MDDNTKIVNQNTSPMVQDDQAQDQPMEQVGSVNKEAGPAGNSDNEVIKPTDVEPQISPELKESGVEAKSEKPELTFEHREIGMDHSGSNISVVAQPSGAVKLPMLEEEIEEKLKTGQDDDSGKWLAGLLKKIIKAMGF